MDNYFTSSDQLADVPAALVALRRLRVQGYDAVLVLSVREQEFMAVFQQARRQVEAALAEALVTP